MGVTISHTTLAPISMASTIIGFISFGFTLATFFNVFWSAIITLYAAPGQIGDYLSNLKQGLLEERRHLRRVKRRVRRMRRGSHKRGRSASDDDLGGDGGGGRRRRSSGGGGDRGPSRKRSQKEAMHFDRDIQAINSEGESASLESMRVAIRDMIREFKRVEYPFLKPEFQHQNSSAWSTGQPYSNGPEKSYASPYGHQGRDRDDDEEDHNLRGSNRLGAEYRKCTFRERWLWLRRKSDVIFLSEALSRQEVRRTAHEVGQVMMMVGDIGQDVEDVRSSLQALEGRMSRVVGIRRVE